MAVFREPPRRRAAPPVRALVAAASRSRVPAAAASPFRALVAAALTFVAGAAAAGCAVGTSPCEPHATYAVTSPPPKPLPETPSARPTPGMAWVPGYWHWDATHYVWVPGHWETPPPGRRWQPAETSRKGDGYRYRAAGWACGSAHDVLTGGRSAEASPARPRGDGGACNHAARARDGRARPAREPG